MKKMLMVYITAAIFFGSYNQVFAVVQDQRDLKNFVELKNQKLENIKEDVKEKMASRASFMKFFTNGKIAFESGDLKSINGNTLTITKEDKTYTVLVDGGTQIHRKFWGKSELSEFSVGDKINVVGVWEDEAKLTIRAKFIRNLSVQKRHGVFIGVVKEKNETGFVLQTTARGDQKVTINSNTIYYNRKMEKINFSDIVNGHRIKVRGLWDSNLSTISEVTNIKDFSLPVIAVSSAKPE